MVAGYFGSARLCRNRSLEALGTLCTSGDEALPSNSASLRGPLQVQAPSNPCIWNSSARGLARSRYLHVPNRLSRARCCFHYNRPRA